MPRQPRQLAESGLYHVMLRGVNRDAIFLEDEDRQRFLSSLGRVKAASGCLVLAYCLMTNHVHLVLRTTSEPISLVMKRLGVRYVGWFNRKYGRVGHLFQSRFTSLPVEDDAYLITLLRYVWNNPVEAGLTRRAEEYRWSSRYPSGPGTALVDSGVLKRLVPLDVLNRPVGTAQPLPQFAPSRTGRPSRYTDEQAIRLLRACCGAGGREAFEALSPGDQLRAIRELRTRSVPHAQIAHITGLSTWQVKQAHVAGVDEWTLTGPPPT